MDIKEPLQLAEETKNFINLFTIYETSQSVELDVQKYVHYGPFNYFCTLDGGISHARFREILLWLELHVTNFWSYCFAAQPHMHQFDSDESNSGVYLLFYFMSESDKILFLLSWDIINHG